MRFLLIFLFSFLVSPLYATPDPTASVTDRLAWMEEDRFVVLRQTELGFGTYFQSRTQYERLEISIYDGRVLSRCSLGVEEYIGDETVTYNKMPPDIGCEIIPDGSISPITPLLIDTNVKMLDGQIFVGRPDEGQVFERYPDVGKVFVNGRTYTYRMLADQNFVFSRLEAMTASEREKSCEAYDTQVWESVFGGCEFSRPFAVSYGGDENKCSVSTQDRGLRTSRDRIFIPISCPMITDYGSSLDTWIVIGRQWLDRRLQ